MSKTYKDQRAKGMAEVRKKNGEGAKKLGERMVKNYQAATKPKGKK